MSVGVVFSRTDEEGFYWLRVFEKHGMTLAQAEELAFEPGVDRHDVMEALRAGCPGPLAYEIFHR